MAEFQSDATLNLAGQVAMTTSIAANARMDFEAIVMGTHDLLEAMQVHKPDCTVIYSSTNKVYGDLEQYTYSENDTRFVCNEKPAGFNEQTQLGCLSPYGCSKGAAVQYMQDDARIFDLKSVLFSRSSCKVTDSLQHTNKAGWVGFSKKVIEISRGKLKEEFTISGTGKQVLDVLHAEDIKRLYMAAMNNIDTAKGQAFNIGGAIDNSLSLIELLRLLEEILNIKMNYTKLPLCESD